MKFLCNIPEVFSDIDEWKEVDADNFNEASIKACEDYDIDSETYYIRDHGGTGTVWVVNPETFEFKSFSIIAYTDIVYEAT